MLHAFGSLFRASAYERGLAIKVVSFIECGGVMSLLLVSEHNTEQHHFWLTQEYHFYAIELLICLATKL